MQQWEYHTVTLMPIAGLTKLKGWKLKQINEQELPNWKNAEMYSSTADFCNQMGLQGWELVSAVAYDGLMFCFKRPRVNETP